MNGTAQHIVRKGSSFIGITPKSLEIWSKRVIFFIYFYRFLIIQILFSISNKTFKNNSLMKQLVLVFLHRKVTQRI